MRGIILNTQITIKTMALNQEMQNKQFRNAKNSYYATLSSQQYDSVPTNAMVEHHGLYKQLLRDIYRSPSYKIIRGIKKLNWKLRKRPKKGYYYPATEALCEQECIKILTSTSWNMLGMLHAVYQLCRKLGK